MPDFSESNSRYEYRVSGKETLADLLERVRETPGTELLLDITDHDILRSDGSLRRTLVAAATEYGKHVAFSFLEKARNKKISTRVLPDIHEEEYVIDSENGRNFSLGDQGKKAALYFSFFAGLLFAGSVYFLLPRASVKIFVDAQPVSADLKILVSPGNENGNKEMKTLRTSVEKTEQVVEGVFTVENQTQVGEKARGDVTLINKTGVEQRIKSKSRLKASNGMIFTMDSAAVVPSRGSAIVKITAEEGGVKGNLPSGSLAFVALPADAGQILFAEIGDPLSGGEDKFRSILKEEDLKKASIDLLNYELPKIKEKFMAGLNENVFKNERLFHAELTDVTAGYKLGSEIAEFPLRGKIVARYLTFANEDLLDAVKQSIAEKVSAGKTLVSPLETASAVVERTDWGKETAELNYVVRNTVHAKIDVQSVKRDLVGRTADGAVKYLTGITGVKNAEIKLNPFWVKRITGLKKNIKVEIVTNSL